MKILICGSRTAIKYNDLKELVQDCVLLMALTKKDKVTLISGGARGADKMAERVAKELELEIEVVRAEWDKHGKAAGMIRNNKMIEMGPDLIIACWDGKSKGTNHTIEMSKRKGIAVKIIQEKILD